VPEADLAAVLDRVSRDLAEATASYGTTLELVARTAGGILGGSCVLFVVDGTGRELTLAAAWDPDEERLGVIEKAFSGARLSLLDPVFSEALLAAGTERFDPIDWSLLRGWADDQAVDILEQLGPSALVTVPLRARGTTPGILGLIIPAGDGAMSDVDRTVLRQLGDRVALAIDTARLLQAAEREHPGRRLPLGSHPAVRMRRGRQHRAHRRRPPSPNPAPVGIAHREERRPDLP
jgi:GAF domain-containing protein